jgi:hypothetical protein
MLKRNATCCHRRKQPKTVLATKSQPRKVVTVRIVVAETKPFTKNGIQSFFNNEKKQL